jgi:hypothetical protein
VQSYHIPTCLLIANIQLIHEMPSEIRNILLFNCPETVNSWNPLLICKVYSYIAKLCSQYILKLNHSVYICMKCPGTLQNNRITLFNVY